MRELLAGLLYLVALGVWLWPESLGRWLAAVHAGFIAAGVK
jgi:hypothetical protein